MAHVHTPYAEVDDDGMYEPRCEGCNIFTELSAILRRYASWHEAAAASATVLNMWEVDSHDDATANS